MTKNYVTTGELAKAWGCSRDTIRRMCADGLLEGTRRLRGTGRHWRIPVKHLGQKNIEADDQEKAG